MVLYYTDGGGTWDRAVEVPSDIVPTSLQEIKFLLCNPSASDIQGVWTRRAPWCTKGGDEGHMSGSCW